MNIINVVMLVLQKFPYTNFHFLNTFFYSGKFEPGKSEKHIIKLVWPKYSQELFVSLFFQSSLLTFKVTGIVL